MAAGVDMYQVATGSMDVVVCTLALCSLKNQEQILQEVRRVLRPVNVGCGGLLSSNHHHQGQPSQFQQIKHPNIKVKLLEKILLSFSKKS